MKNVSIIVPIYNSSKYLTKCLNSLVNQTLENIEIILVDDCSLDNSKQIINDYYDKYKEKIVPIYLEENKRQGFARNIAIKKAKGEYIIFVDSDDYIDLEMCELLYKKAKEKDFDIVCFNLMEIINGISKEKKLAYDNTIEGNIDINKRNILFNSQGYFTTRMYKRKMLIDNKIKFPEGIHYEDSAFNTLTLLYANSIAKIDRPLYFYCIRNGSSSNCYNEERLYDRITTCNFMINEVKKRELYEKYRSIIDKKYLKMMIGNIHLCLDMFDKPDYNRMKIISRNLNKNIKEYKKIQQYKDLDKISKIYLRINEISPKLLRVIDLTYKWILNTIIKNKGYVQ